MMRYRYSEGMSLLALSLAFASSPSPTADVAIVPGCPSADDGTLSHCQQRRVAWAGRLWAEGRVANVITSGAAVYNPYVEADVMADALVALGVPEERVWRERDALHTDENMAWSLAIAEREGFDEIVVATDMFQAQVGCAMIRAWSAVSCVPEPVDYTRASRDIRSAMRAFSGLFTAPLSHWLPLEEREDTIAEVVGQKERPASLPMYLKGALGGDAPRPAPHPPALRTPAS